MAVAHRSNDRVFAFADDPIPVFTKRAWRFNATWQINTHVVKLDPGQ